MESNETPYPFAFVYDEPSQAECINFQVLTDANEHIAGGNVNQLKRKLELEKIQVGEIIFLTKEQIAGLNLVPIEFIRPFGKIEKDELSAS
jgi:hypothetical protein